MKTSKAQQAEVRRQILRTAADLMTLHGFEGTTMKEIARVAGIGDATIYKYFPTKEKLLMGYHEQATADALADALATPGWAEFNLQERLQRLVDALLERLLPDREFVQLTRALVQRSPLLALRDGLPGHEALRQQVLQWLTQAEARGEMPPCAFKGAISHFSGDYLMGVLAFWLNDDSEDFSDTTRLVDLSLGLAVGLLQTDLLGRASELLGFVLRGQISRWLRRGTGLDSGALLGGLAALRQHLGPHAGHTAYTAGPRP